MVLNQHTEFKWCKYDSNDGLFPEPMLVIFNWKFRNKHQYSFIQATAGFNHENDVGKMAAIYSGLTVLTLNIMNCV